MTSFICGLTRLADSDSIDDRGVPRLLFMGNVCQFAFNSHGCAVVKITGQTAIQTLNFFGDEKIENDHFAREQRGAWSRGGGQIQVRSFIQTYLASWW